MTTLLRALLLCSLTLGLSLSAGEKGNNKGEGNKGEGGKGGGMGMLKRTPEIDFALEHAKELNLTAEQKKKLNDLKNKIEDQREKAMKDPEAREVMKEVMAARKSGDEEKLRQLHEKVREKMGGKNGGEELMADFPKIFTPDQLAKLKELHKAEGGPSKGGKGAGGKSPEGQKPDPKKGVPSLFENEK